MMLEQFIGHYTNQVVSFDQVPENSGQSVQLIAAWCRFIGLPHHWGTPREWWESDDPAFDKQWLLNEYEENELERPSPGDIVVFGKDLPGSGGEAHLSLFVSGGEDPQEWTGFDAGWSGQSAHLQSHNWAYVAGWFTPINKSVLEAFIPTPIAPPIPSGAYDLEIIPALEATVTAPQAALYNLNDASWNSFMINTVKTVDTGTKVDVTAVAKHRLGGTFFMPDPTRAEGYRAEDLDYDPPKEGSAALVGKPEIARSEKKNEVGIYAPLSSPALHDTIQLKKRVPGYKHVSDAIRGQNSLGLLEPNRYFIFKHGLSGMINVTVQPGRLGQWINPEDLTREEEQVPATPPAQAPWKQTFSYLTDRLDDAKLPVYYQAKYSTFVEDIEGIRPPLPLKCDQKILIAGFFVGPDGERYAAPQLTVERDPPQWYGVREEALELVPTPVPAVSEDVHVLAKEEMPSFHLESASNASPLQIRVKREFSGTPTDQPLPLYAKIYLLIKNLKTIKTLKERYKDIK